jgi:glycosyltransferase involved in cell wall biosynthesis
MTKLKLAIIGTNGIPAKYGGFETLAENLAIKLSQQYEIEVYCSLPNQVEKLDHFNGAKLIYLPLKANGWQSFFYDFISSMRAFLRSDVILILGPACGLVIPGRYFFRKKVLVNHGGLDEWKREKYSFFKRGLVWINHYAAAKFSNINIVDNMELEASLRSNFNVSSKVIRYGGDHVLTNHGNDCLVDKYSFASKPYFLCVARAQVDNNLHMILEAFASNKNDTLVMISNWRVSDYALELQQKYKSFENIILLDAIYDQSELNFIRKNASCYVHSHSRCGTAPSLVEAISLELPVISYDCATNRETTHGNALFFTCAKSLESIIESISKTDLARLGSLNGELARKYYTWDEVSRQYSELIAS